MGNNNIYWKGFEELNKNSEIVEKLEQNEFVEKLPVGKEDKDNNPNRRDFLKFGMSGSGPSIFLSFKQISKERQILRNINKFYPLVRIEKSLYFG